MPVEIVTVPCLSDNYAYLVRDQGSGQVAVVDAPEAGPIIDALDAHQEMSSQALNSEEE